MDKCPTSVASEDEFLYDYLLDTGVLNDVHTVVESIVSSSMSSSSSSSLSATSNNDDAQRIADRLLERNAVEIDKELAAIVRKVKIGAEFDVAGTRSVDFNWPRKLDIGPGRSQRDTLRNLNALTRLPFTNDMYAGANFRRLTEGLEHAVASPVDAFFGPALRVYARLVDAAPDFESAAESFGSLCEATHLRCIARTVNYGKSVAAVCLCMRCLSTVCKRGAAAGSNKTIVKSSIVEFVAAITAGPLRHDNECSPYGILCCADPTATWFDSVAKCHSTRSAFFECLTTDRTLLNAVVTSFCDWMTEPAIPVKSGTNNDDRSRAASTVKYACFLHATHLLAKMFAYHAVRTMFPVKVTKATRIHPTGISNYCLGFLSANRDGVPNTLARGLCDLVTAIAAFRTEVVDSVMGNLSKFGLRVLAEAIGHRDVFDAVVKRDGVLDELFRKTHWKVNNDDANVTAMDSLIRIAIVLSDRHEEIWRFITRRMSFLEVAVASRRKATAVTPLLTQSLLTKVRCTPLGEFTYEMDDGWQCGDDYIDWRDPQKRLMFSVSCATCQGRRWLDRIDAFRSLDAYVESCLNEAETSLDLDFNSKSLDSIVDVAYSHCASIGGLEILLDGRSKLTEIYHLSYENFDDHTIPRDVLVTLWLRLMEVATFTLSTRIFIDLKLNYQETLLKFLAENSAENGTIIIDRTTELLTKLQRYPAESADSYASSTTTAVSSAITSNADDHGSGWLQRLRAKIIRRSDQISGAEMLDLITLFGRQRFGEQQFDPDTFDCNRSDATDFDSTGIRFALRYGSSVGLVDENSALSELEQIYGSVERRGGWTRSFDCMICTLFIASQGSKNKCIEACSVLSKLKETTRFVWSAAFDGNTESRAAFGHLVEELLQRELPEVHNAFKMSGVSWWLLCSGWMSDCFWGRLIWPEICRWICLIIMSPIDYQVFFFICLAAAQKQKWLEAFNRGRFHDAVFQDNFYNFRLVDHADYLENLAKKYKQSLSKRLVFEFDMN